MRTKRNILKKLTISLGFFSCDFPNKPMIQLCLSKRQSIQRHNLHSTHCRIFKVRLSECSAFICKERAH